MKRNIFLLALLLFSYTVKAQTTFHPVPFQAKPQDYSQLASSLQQKEERTNRAYEAYSELSTLIGDKYMQIHHDEESLKWFNNNIRSLSQKVMNEINAGNPGKAYNLAITYKGIILSNSELIARIRTNKEYTEVRNQVMSRNDLSYEIKQEWDKKYPYKFVPIKGQDGETIGGYDWMQVGGPNNTRVIIP